MRAGGAARWLPGLRVAAAYERAWLRHDLRAAVVLTALLVPQGMAYAALAGLPPVAGLYATMIPLAAYALFGPSRLLVLGPDSAVAPVVAAAIIPIAGSDMEERVALAAMLAVIAGAVMVVGALAGLGFVADLLSKPVRLGYLAGIAVTAIASQLPALLGLEGQGGGLRASARLVVERIEATDAVAVAIGIGTLAVILLWQRLTAGGGGILVAVAAATVLVAVLDLSTRIATVGSLPKGLPGFALPDVAAGDLAQLAGAALAIALVAVADTTVLSRSYAARLGEEVDQNQEFLALGVANVSSGLFHGFPISSSSSRTPVAEAAGARTQLTGLAAAVILGLLLVFGTGLVRDLPSAALAAVVVAAVLALIDVSALRRLWHVDRLDFALALVSFAGVVAFGVLPGIGIAVGVSIATFLWHAWHPYDATLGRRRGIKGYHDVGRHPDALQVPGLVLYRFDAPLFFANAGIFHARALRAVQHATPPARWLVVAAEPITDVDSTAADMLFDLARDLDALGIELVLAEVKGPVKDALRRYGLVDRIGEHNLFPTVGAAVHGYVEAFAVPWVDWEDERGDG